MLPINEVFETIQGEAFFTGTPSVFIRLQGCGVGCPWCDTKYTWNLDKTKQTNADWILENKDRWDSDEWAQIEEAKVAEWTIGKARHVVITGGEPCDYDLTDLTTRLIDMGKTVQIETSGTAEIRAHPRSWVTLSPKINMPGGKTVLDSAVSRCREIKMPVGKERDVEVFEHWLALHQIKYPMVMIWLQPLSESAKATDVCVKAATARDGWRVSLQSHKAAGLR